MLIEHTDNKQAVDKENGINCDAIIWAFSKTLKHYHLQFEIGSQLLRT